MRIIFVRHGHPNYKDDCLTPLGHRHAEAAAIRLQDESVQKICASTCGRAIETANHIAAKHGLAVETFDFMREISWGGIHGESIPFGGHPWDTADDMAQKSQTLMDPNWAQIPPFSNNKICSQVEQVGKDFDIWLADFGYVREGEFYRVRRCNSDTIMMVSHGGSSSAVLSHLLNLPFPFVCNVIRSDFTSITVLQMDGSENSLISPKIEILTDARHIAGITTDQIKEDSL